LVVLCQEKCRVLLLRDEMSRHPFKSYMTFSIEARLNGSSASFDNFRKNGKKSIFVAKKNWNYCCGNIFEWHFFSKWNVLKLAIEWRKTDNPSCLRAAVTFIWMTLSRMTVSKMTLRRMTVSLMKVIRMTVSITTVITRTASRMTLRKMTSRITTVIIRQPVEWQSEECHTVKWQSTEWQSVDWQSAEWQSA